MSLSIGGAYQTKWPMGDYRTGRGPKGQTHAPTERLTTEFAEITEKIQCVLCVLLSKWTAVDTISSAKVFGATRLPDLHPRTRSDDAGRGSASHVAPCLQSPSARETRPLSRTSSTRRESASSRPDPITRWERDRGSQRFVRAADALSGPEYVASLAMVRVSRRVSPARIRLGLALRAPRSRRPPAHEAVAGCALMRVARMVRVSRRGSHVTPTAASGIMMRAFQPCGRRRRATGQISTTSQLRARGPNDFPTALGLTRSQPRAGGAIRSSWSWAAEPSPLDKLGAP